MRIHPLVAGAAVSVMALSIAGVAAITGYLPTSKAEKSAVALPKQCFDCGVIVSVKQMEVKGKGTGIGAIAGGAAGAVVGHELGGGKDLATVIGAGAGAIAGHEVEREVRTTKRYRVEVRMDDGTMKSLTFSQPPAWKSGDRVRLENGKLLPQSA